MDSINPIPSQPLQQKLHKQANSTVVALVELIFYLRNGSILKQTDFNQSLLFFV